MNIKKIKENHGEYASFAVWDKGDLTNIKIIENSVSKLHSRVVIVGFNASAELRTFGNFHGREEGAPGIGNRDSWLREVFNDPESPCHGAYMTDVFKHTTAVRENDVRTTQKQEKKAKKLFEKELRDIGAKNPIILAIGNEAEEQLLAWGYCPFIIPHYAGRISRKGWLSRTKEVVSTIK